MDELDGRFFISLQLQKEHMVHQLIGFYSERPDYSPKPSDQLAIEIDQSQIVFLVKNNQIAEIEAVEVFEFEKSDTDWSDIFFEIRQQSKLLGINYAQQHIFFNVEQSLVLPLSKMSTIAAEDYLSLMYGPEDKSITRFDTIEGSTPTATVYRVKKTLLEVLNHHFLLYKSAHVYTNILNDLLNRETLSSRFIKMVVYPKHIVLVLMKDDQLQMIQSYPYQTIDDILYHTLNLAEQFGIVALQTTLELSGMIDAMENLIGQLRISFGIIQFDSLESALPKPGGFSDYAFTPYFKLLA